MYQKTGFIPRSSQGSSLSASSMHSPTLAISCAERLWPIADDSSETCGTPLPRLKSASDSERAGKIGHQSDSPIDTIMTPTSLDFYEALAEYYHLIFEDWDRSIERQAGILNPLIVKDTGRCSVNLLDCACGIGTQAIGFAQGGHSVVACDSSLAAVNRAKREARERDLDISFFVSDMTSLGEITRSDFNVVAA
jgi:Methyltransferase domain